MESNLCIKWMAVEMGNIGVKSTPITVCISNQFAGAPNELYGCSVPVLLS